MTFIASVVANNGVAIIADSLVTTSTSSIEFSEFLNFLTKEAEKSEDGDIKLDPQEIIKLFKSRPSYTKDYEDKLFEFDPFTAITTAGSASINDKRIGNIINSIIEENKKDNYYSRKGIETKIKHLCRQLEKEIKSHLGSKRAIRPTKFILSHFDRKKNETLIYKIDVNSASKEDLGNPSFKFTSFTRAEPWEKVVCDGQNRISERILYGALEDVYNLVPRIANKIIEDFELKDVPEDYISKLSSNGKILSPDLLADMKIFKLSSLSLQQAVDLASLLMRLEIDFQTYTENIPTVGGVIKMAVINKDGLTFINGHDVAKPNNI